jgi:hypothetical protein
LTQLEVTNLALKHLGQNSITQAQLTANTDPRAVNANVFWEPCRDEVLGEARWSFATSTLALSSIDTTDLEWEYVYTYPTMCVGTVWNVYDEGTITNKEEQQFEVKYLPSQSNKCIYTNLADAYAEFTYKVTDPEIWSDKFAMAFSYRLASSMAVPLTGDADKGLKLMEIYNAILGEAKRLGSSEKRTKPNQDSNYVNARG